MISHLLKVWLIYERFKASGILINFKKATHYTKEN